VRGNFRRLQNVRLVAVKLQHGVTYAPRWSITPQTDFAGVVLYCQLHLPAAVLQVSKPAGLISFS